MSKNSKNKLYFGGNLDIMREHIPAESVDLIYLDSPYFQLQNSLKFDRINKAVNITALFIG